MRANQTPFFSRYLATAIGAAAAFASLALACGSSSSSPPGGNTDLDASGAADVTNVQPTLDSSVGPTDAGISVVDTGTATGDSALPPVGDGGFVQASHLGLPTIVYADGRVLRSPKLVTVTFPGDTMAADLAAFGAGETQTQWWSSIMMSQYCQTDGGCVGTGQTGTAVALTTPAAPEYDDNYDHSVSDGGIDLTTWLTGLITAGTLPPSDENTLYMIYMPSSTTVTQGGAAGCQAFDGYHANTKTGVVYAIAMECSGYQLDNVTLTAAHETAEAASDPTPFSQTNGYVTDGNDPNNWGWEDESDGEIADMCDDYLGLGQDHWVEGKYTYQRIWSVEAAAANTNPCLPIPPGEVYFNAAPVEAYYQLNVGESITLEVDAFSDSATGDWNLLAEDATQASDSTPSFVKVSFAGGTTSATGLSSVLNGVNNGTKAQLTVTLTADPSNDTSGEEADIMIWSYQGTDVQHATAGRYWPFSVGTRGLTTDAGITFIDGGVPLHPRRQLRNGTTRAVQPAIKRSFHGRTVR